jgi:hypothetical protein
MAGDTLKAARADQAPGTERAIQADPRLTEDQKSALIAVYRSMVGPGD